jgi:hypothetical protein
MNVEAEVNRHKNCTDRSKLEKLIQEYKGLAVQHATNFVMASQYNNVALQLQKLCDRLPAPHFKNIPGSTPGAPAQVRTATISDEEDARIKAAWKQKTSGKH